jgi:arabinan endo-1,5-alpha-L-arabinosidase
MSKLRLILLAVAACVGLSLSAPPVVAGATQAGRSGGQAAAPTYRNPMQLRLPNGAQAESCADPSVLRSRTAGDRHWYLYCTSDALTSTELGPDGKPLIHNVPMFRSTDLVHWTYQGDAFPTKPSWVSGFVWAPDIVFHNGHYLLYYAASDTNLPGGGSAVGVATSDSPTGPWTDSSGPVVPPTGPAGSRRWEFDPEVIYVAGKTYLYFGSYFGGIFARELTADGLSSIASTETRIAIDNRYEGTYIVRHDGWFYFMGSATNCCNGPLTGYAVFAARSRSPLGPFLDSHGRSILDSRVGGTPVLTQNGNRWVGPGHNAVVTDYSGQDWIVYHAVDRNDPYYAGDVGYTKRPALIDPLDWKRGWPTVRGGAGPSDKPMPGPAAQPGWYTAYRPHFVRDPHPGHMYRSLSDNFSGSALSSRWTWIRPPDPSTYRVAGGALHWQTQPGDLHPSTLPPAPSDSLASVLTEPAPAGDYVVETKVKVDFPTDASCCYNYVQGGLLIYGDDGNYVKLASVSIWNTRQTEFGKQILPQPAGYPTYGNTVVGPVGDWTYLRIVRHHAGSEDTYTAYTSLDGRHWDHGGTWTHDLGRHPRIGLISMGGAGFTSTFDYVRVSTVH